MITWGMFGFEEIGDMQHTKNLDNNYEFRRGYECY